MVCLSVSFPFSDTDGLVGRIRRTQAEGHRPVLCVATWGRGAILEEPGISMTHTLSSLYAILAVSAAISPFQQRAMAGALSGWVFHGYKRIMAQAPYFALPVGIGAYSSDGVLG